MPPVRTADERRPRQDPVSCQLCRSKKLKCDRQTPCSNCKSRNLNCEYQGHVRPPLPSSPASNPNGDSHLDYAAENTALRARLRRLEDAVFGQSSPGTRLEQDHVSSAPSASTPAKPRTEDDKAEEDSNWLEAVGSRSYAVLPQFTAPLEVNICPIIHFQYPQEQSLNVRSIDVPAYDVVTGCLNAYSDSLDSVQHIMHVDSSRNMIDRLYSQLNARRPVDPGALAFVLSLCANIGFYWTVGFHRRAPFFQDADAALKVSTEWTKQAMFAIERARVGSPSTSIEAIQASVMLMFILYHIEGFTFRVRMLHASAVAMARDLGLHRTDMPGFRPQAQTQADIVDLEVRRKLWWHLSCSDWFLSFVGGPNEGMYSIHPRHMQVNLPRNVNREDLNTREATFQRSMSEPTLMSYYLQRIRLAHTCREISDALYKSLDPTDVDYEVVRRLDDKFESQVQELPRFLRFDLPPAQLRLDYGDAYNHQSFTQAIMVNLMIGTRRCKLHLPYLIRAKTNPRYAFSRRTGLQAARSVFNIRRIVMEDKGSASAAHLKLGGIRQHIFYATVVLVMDLCVNRDDDDKGQIAEVREALKIIQEREDCTVSQMGDQFYDSLMAVLKKHHVKLEHSRQADGYPNATALIGAQHTTQAYLPTANGSASVVQQAPNPFADLDNSGLAFDGSMWADFLEQAPTLEAQDWDALLTDLDMRMI